MALVTQQVVLLAYRGKFVGPIEGISFYPKKFVNFNILDL